MNDRQDTLSIIRGVGGDPADLPFWEGCREGKFRLHRCELCRRHYWPASRCIVHGDEAMVWADSAAHGQLHTYTVLHRALTSAMKDKVPYVVGVVQLDEGPFYHANLIHCDHREVRVGMRLAPVMIEHHSGLVIPVFEPVA